MKRIICWIFGHKTRTVTIGEGSVFSGFRMLSTSSDGIKTVCLRCHKSQE